MSRRFHAIEFRAKAILCIALTVFAQFSLTGCGANIFSGPTAGMFQVPLTPGSPILDALEGSPFSDAVAVNILPATQEFQFVFPDSTRKLAGKYAYTNASFTITEFSFTHKGRTADVTMDTGKRIQQIDTSEGYSWTPSRNDARVTYPPSVRGAFDYLDANPDVVSMAKNMDAQAGISTGGTVTTPVSGPTVPVTTPKGGTTADTNNNGNTLAAVLAVIASIWAPLIGVLSPLLSIFSVATLIQNALNSRFDGTWTAVNSDSNLLVTISGGKITRMVDKASSQELTILESRLDRIDGNKVTWVVDAQVLGQATSVNFTFDMQENADGSLKGTLTALGSNFARVPVTMTRS